MAGLRRMFKFGVVAFAADALPTCLFQAFDEGRALHKCVILHILWVTATG